MRPQRVSASGQKKGIFGEPGRKRGDGIAPGQPLTLTSSRNRRGTAARVSAEPIGVMSLSEKNLLLRFPNQARHQNASGNNSSRLREWRNKLKNRSN
jgi:hypothetical protein